MLELNVPDAAWSTNTVSLGNTLYTIDFLYNSTDERWRINIFIEDEPVLLGLKLMEQSGIIAKYRHPLFNHGELFVIRRENDGLPCTRDNLGFNKPYGLFYFSNEELED